MKVAEHSNVARLTRALEARARGKFDAKDTKIILDEFWGIVADEEKLNAFWAPPGASGSNGDADGS